jgi:ribosome-associated heat shock protein Hsp15
MLEFGISSESGLFPIGCLFCKEMLAETPIRLDKWLWAVRIFKTRSLASAACRKGQVRISGQAAKPSRAVKIDDTILVEKEEIVRTLKVLQLLERRVGAAAVAQFMEDQTPASELEKAPALKTRSPVFRPKGLGRPTKKNRRLTDLLFQAPDETAN